MLFLDRKAMLERAWCVNKLKLCGNYEASLLYVDRLERPFADYEAFMQYCFSSYTQQAKEEKP